MARLPIPRVVGIAAWSAASVAWGTTAVAVANHTEQPVDAEPAEAAPVVAPDPQPIVEQAPVPTMPEGGLVVLRYTPSEAPLPETIIRRVVVASSSGDGPAHSASAATGSTPPPPATTRSSGS